MKEKSPLIEFGVGFDRKAVNMLFVTAVEPYSDETTSVLVLGSSEPFVVDAPYDEVVAKWREFAES